MKKSKTLSPSEEILNDSIVDVKISDIIPNVIDDFIVTIFENHQTIVLPSHITGQQFRAWYKDRGGVFSKDVLNYSLGKTYGNYVIIKNESLHCIARIILEEEELQFKTLKLVYGQIKDRPYMILRKLEENEPISCVKRYINDIDKLIETEEDEEIISDTRNASVDDDFEHHTGSISLFTSD